MLAVQKDSIHELTDELRKAKTTCDALLATQNELEAKLQAEKDKNKAHEKEAQKALDRMAQEADKTKTALAEQTDLAMKRLSAIDGFKRRENVQNAQLAELTQQLKVLKQEAEANKKAAAVAQEAQASAEAGAASKKRLSSGMDDSESCSPPKKARKDEQGTARVHALQEISSTLTCMLQARSHSKGKGNLKSPMSKRSVTSPKGFAKAGDGKGLDVFASVLAKSNATKRAGADDLLYAKETLAWPSSSRHHLAATASPQAPFRRKVHAATADKENIAPNPYGAKATASPSAANLRKPTRSPISHSRKPTSSPLHLRKPSSSPSRKVHSVCTAHVPDPDPDPHAHHTTPHCITDKPEVSVVSIEQETCQGQGVAKEGIRMHSEHHLSPHYCYHVNESEHLVEPVVCV